MAKANIVNTKVKRMILLALLVAYVLIKTPTMHLLTTWMNCIIGYWRHTKGHGGWGCLLMQLDLLLLGLSMDKH